MEAMGATELAGSRGAPHGVTGWLWAAAIVAFYLLVRFLLAYAANRRAGAERPAHQVWTDARHRQPAERREGLLPRYLLGRAVLVVGMLLFLPVALIPAKWLRIAILAVAGPVVVAVVAYADHRTGSRRRARESEQPV
ncbi:hypothetical protein [Streptomyces sp. NBC_01198]|uniref:hypothetical protein n=1 Tax=Streptomyces sp. NBC_01198 TaxID=2903769 RepID=UPI002E151BA6|nr:hypothetical protein OG702_34525 [Streptomyces sp. NBC_01198]